MRLSGKVSGTVSVEVSEESLLEGLGENLWDGTACGFRERVWEVFEKVSGRIFVIPGFEKNSVHNFFPDMSIYTNFPKENCS